MAKYSFELKKRVVDAYLQGEGDKIVFGTVWAE